MTPEKTATIRNKLQAAKTALELIHADKPVSKEFIAQAINDLDEVLEAINK